MVEQLLMGEATETLRSLLRGAVEIVVDAYHSVVRVNDGVNSWDINAELVVSSEKPLRLSPGDFVLCLLDSADRDRGLVLGRIGLSPSSSERAASVQADGAVFGDPPETLVVEAKQSLTLRVGQGSITIREDGRVLIKGKDLVSHAQRMNRIKGGAVSIN